MADEVQLQIVAPGTPETVMAEWRAQPPKALRDEGYEIVDESYNALVFAVRYYDWPQKLLFVTTLGFALLFRGFMGSWFKLTARFDAEGSSRTRITLLGTAHPRTRARLADLAAEHGGSVGLRVGV